MSSLPYSNPPGFGSSLSDRLHFSQAVRIPPNAGIIKISGQGGWDPKTGEIPDPVDASSIRAQVKQTYANVDEVLRNAGAKNGWGDVYALRCYWLEMTAHENAVYDATIEELRKWCPDHKPIATGVEVQGLGLEGMRIEIEVEAIIA